MGKLFYLFHVGLIKYLKYPYFDICSCIKVVIMCVILQRRYVERGLVSFSSFVGLEMFVAPCVVGMMV